MTLAETKQAIWDHPRIKGNIIDLQVFADRALVRLPITDIREAEKLLKSLTRKVKVKAATPKWCIERYEQAHKEWFSKQFPHCMKDGHYIESIWPDVGLTNGLTTFVQNFIEWSGGDANPLNVMGRKVKDRWIPSSTKKGTEDLDVTWRGKKIAIEIKNAATKDKISPAQLKRKAKLESCGAIYLVVTGVENFFEQWDKVSVQKTIFE